MIELKILNLKINGLLEKKNLFPFSKVPKDVINNDAKKVAGIFITRKELKKRVKRRFCVSP